MDTVHEHCVRVGGKHVIEWTALKWRGHRSFQWEMKKFFVSSETLTQTKDTAYETRLCLFVIPIKSQIEDMSVEWELSVKWAKFSVKFKVQSTAVVGGGRGPGLKWIWKFGFTGNQTELHQSGEFIITQLPHATLLCRYGAHQSAL